MKRLLLISAMLCLAISMPYLSAAEDGANDQPSSSGKFILSSSTFINGGQIPEQYTCKGADTNPFLLIKNTPKGTRSLVLTVVEPDNPITPWAHWLVFNINPGVREIKPGAVPGTQALNDFGNFYYGGPCAFDAKKHHFIFTIYALSETLDEVLEGATRDFLEKAMQGKIIDRAILVGVYQNPMWGKEDLPL